MMAGKSGLRLSSIVVVVVVISVVAGLSVVNASGVARPSLARSERRCGTAQPSARSPGQHLQPGHRDRPG